MIDGKCPGHDVKRPPTALWDISGERKAKGETLTENIVLQCCAIMVELRELQHNPFAVGCSRCRMMRGSWRLRWSLRCGTLSANTPLRPGFVLVRRSLEVSPLLKVNRLVAPIPGAPNSISSRRRRLGLDC
jgi:hypothetical protein